MTRRTPRFHSGVVRTRHACRLLAGVLLLAACTSAPDRAAPPPAAPAAPIAAPAAEPSAPAARVEPIRIGYASRSVSFLAMLLAHDQGYYREQGLDAEVIQIRPNVGMTALLSGEVDYTETLGSNVRAAAQGAPVRTVLVSMLAPPFGLVSRTDISTPAQLRGRVIGITSLGATNEIVTRLVLQHFGLEAQRDVQLIAVGDAPVQYEALRLGQIDAAMVAMPYPALARHEGFQLLANAPDLVHLPQTGVGALQSKLEGQRDQVKRVVKAEIQALRYIRAQPQATARLIAELFEIDPAIGEQVYALMAPVFSADGTVERGPLELLLEQARESADLAAPVAFEQVADPSLVPEALGELPLSR
jgi:ABC-type nitrate/sulfonate/bicarbonate transport system substrate-binding protein